MSAIKHQIWAERYRPSRVADLILPNDLKETLQSYVDNKMIPHVILGGPAGTGKTSAALAMCEEIGADKLLINASLNSSLETLRSTLTDFAASSSMNGRKYIILDEFDNANRVHFQPALRGFIEEYSGNCSFIMTANHPQKIIDPLHSRCTFHGFHFEGSEKKELAQQFMTVCQRILKENGVTYEQKALARVIIRSFPDWRKIINDLQSTASRGDITIETLGEASDSLDSLITLMRGGQPDPVRDWVSRNTTNDPAAIYKFIFNNLDDFFDSDSVVEVMGLLCEGSYQSAVGIDPEIGLSTTLVALTLTAEFK